MKVKKSFTILEITLIITLILLLLSAALVVLNPLNQINRANDGRRKSELASLRKILEDYYNDKERFPRPEEICYDAANYIPESHMTTCHICGSNPASPNLSPYMDTLPCDPQNPTRNYIYEVDDPVKPTLYRIYSLLIVTTDPLISQLGCQNGCGPYGICRYNYGVTSTNTAVLTCTGFAPNATPTPTPITAGLCSNYNPLYVNIFQEGQWKCNICGSYTDCKNTYPTQNYYIDQTGGFNPDCTQICTKD